MKHLPAVITALALAAPLSAQQWETISSWQGELGTLVTGAFQLEASNWRIVWETEEIPGVSTVFSVLVMSEPNWDVDEAISGFEPGADTAYVEGPSGAYMLEIASTVPWAASVQQEIRTEAMAGSSVPAFWQDRLQAVRWDDPHASGDLQVFRDLAEVIVERQFVTVLTYLRR